MADDYTLTGSTGKNDADGAWGSGLLNAATGISNLVTAVTGAVKPGPKPAIASPAATPTNWKPILIGAGVVVLVIVGFLALRKR